MSRISIFLLSLLIIASCKNNSTGAGGGKDDSKETVSVAEYDLTPIPGTNMQMAVKSDLDQLVIEQGMVENGVKTGTWAKFFPRLGKLMEVWNYAGGKKNGLHILFNNSGRVDMYESYIDNQLYGKRMTFKLGTPVEEMSYREGKLDGKFRGFSPGGKLQRQGTYINGLQDGDYTVWDDNGQVVLSVKYKNGQVVK